MWVKGPDLGGHNWPTEKERRNLCFSKAVFLEGWRLCLEFVEASLRNFAKKNPLIVPLFCNFDPTPTSVTLRMPKKKFLFFLVTDL
jgi:hypothetical protein